MTSPALGVDASYWYHLRTRDNAGNWTTTVHLGPFPIVKGATTTTVKARVTKRGKIKVSGTLSPPHGGTLQVTLFKKRNGFRRVKQVTAPIGDTGALPPASRHRMEEVPGDGHLAGRRRPPRKQRDEEVPLLRRRSRRHRPR